MTLFTFAVSFSLDSYGGDVVEVLAHNPVEALTAAAGTERGWMLDSCDVRVNRIERRFLAMCNHDSGSQRDSGVWECDDCKATWLDSDMVGADKTATTHGFRAYCETLRVVWDGLDE